jgi:type IV pilus assembly protein PilM
MITGKVRFGHINIQCSDERRLMRGAVQNGYIKDPFIIAGEIGDMLLSNNVKDRNAVFTINSSAILYKELSLPRPRVNATSEVIENMVTNDMGLEGEYIVTYTVIGSVLHQGIRLMKLVARATPRDMMDGYKDLAKQTGLNLTRLMVAANCLSRMVTRSRSTYGPYMPLMILRHEEQFIDIHMYEECQLSVSRYATVDLEMGRTFQKQAVFDNAFHFIHYTEQATGQTPIKSIQYYGGTADPASMTDDLASFNLPVRELAHPPEVIVNPKLLTAENGGKAAYSWLAFASLTGAMYPPNKKTENIDLLNSPERRSAEANRAFMLEAFILTMICVVIVVGTLTFSTLVASFKNSQLSSLQQEYEVLGGDSVAALVASKRVAVNKYQMFIDNVTYAKVMYDFQPRPTSDVAEQLRALLIPGVTLSGNLTLSGYSLNATFLSDSEDSMREFIEVLRDAAYFEGVSYASGYSIVNDGLNGAAREIRFSVSMRIKGGNSFAEKVE